VNKLDDLTSIHHLLRSIRETPEASERKQPGPKESGENTPQAPPENQPQQRQLSRLKVLKRELEKADALLYQLEQDEAARVPAATQPLTVESHQPCSIVRRASQAKPLFTKTSLGLDIGSYAIKAVELGHTPVGYHLLYYALVEVASAAQPQPDYSQTLSKSVSQAIAGVDLNRTEVVTSIGSPSTVIRQLSLPPVSEAELSSCLRWEAKKIVPNNNQQMELDFQFVKPRDDSFQREVLLVAVPRSLLSGHRELLNKTQIKPAITGITPLTLINAYLATGGHEPDEALVLLDMGAKLTTLTIYHQNGGYFVRHISVSGNSLTQQVQRELGLGFWQAEQWKRQHRREKIELVEPLLRQMVLEIRKALTAYKNQNLIRKFNRLCLSGGGAQLPRLDDYLARELGVEVEVFNPLVELNIDGSYFSREELSAVTSQFATAMGLAVRGLAGDRKSLNMSESRIPGAAEADIAQAYIGIFAPAGGGS
jgi:type IV pilus assembly protein PilM